MAISEAKLYVLFKNLLIETIFNPYKDICAGRFSAPALSVILILVENQQNN